jgi:glutaredoxin
MNIVNWGTCPHCENETCATYADGSQRCWVCDWCERTTELLEYVGLSVNLPALQRFAVENPGVEIEVIDLDQSAEPQESEL